MFYFSAISQVHSERDKPDNISKEQIYEPYPVLPSDHGQVFPEQRKIHFAIQKIPFQKNIIPDPIPENGNAEKRHNINPKQNRNDNFILIFFQRANLCIH